MRVLVAGGSGFVGGALCKKLIEQGHNVCCLTRNSSLQSSDVSYQLWDGKVISDGEKYDFIINLCGANISSCRWTRSRKKELRSSRIDTTNAICNYIKNLESGDKPILLNASAVGFYGSCGVKQDEVEYQKSCQNTYSSRLVSEWESSAYNCEKYGTKVSCLRFGVVLDASGGMLKRLYHSFRFGFGAVMGRPEYKLSWVSLEDLCDAVIHIMHLKSISRAYNVTSPHACSKKSFSDCYAESLGSKCRFSMPEWLVELIFGQMGRELLLSDQDIYPRALLETGFEFKHKDISNFFEAQ